MFYICLYSIAACLLYLYKKAKKKQKKYMMIGIVFLFALISGIRYGIGTDYFFTYYPQYNSIQSGNGSLHTNFGIGTYLFFWICAKAGLGFNFCLFVLSFITLLFFFAGVENFAKKENIDSSVCFFLILLFYYQMSFNLVRQVLAMSMLFYALSVGGINKHGLTKKQTLIEYSKRFVFLLFALGFHDSVLIFLLLVPFIKYLSDKKYIVLQSIILIITLYLTLNNEIIINLLSFLKLDYYGGYLRNVDLKLTIGYIVRVIPMVIVILFMRKEILSDKRIYFFTFSFILGYILRLLAYNESNTSIYVQAASQADRIGHYFMLFQCVIYSKFFSKQRRRYSDKLLKIVVFSLLIYLWIYDYIILNLNSTVPYNSIFLK